MPIRNMKTIPIQQIVPLLVGCFLATASPLEAQDEKPVDRVTAKEGKTVVIRGSEQVALEKEVTFSGDIKVLTNALFKVKEGRERTLKEGQVLSAEGTILNSDGSLMPVFDHVVMKNGRVVVVQDGEPTSLDGEMTLADGTRVLADGTVTSHEGTRRKLLDGQMLKLEGGQIPAQDTILLKDGKVYVQKDGSTLEVLPGRTVMMNNGTKVFSDGSVLMRDGKRVTLVEGQVHTIEGVVTRR